MLENKRRTIIKKNGMVVIIDKREKAIMISLRKIKKSL
jgi:hypothetical protein